MSNTTISYGFVVLCVLALGCGQVLFKAVGLRINGLVDLISQPRVALLFFGALSLYGVSTLLWVLALRTIPLSRAYPFMALGFILVPIISHYVFGEKLTINQVVGMAFVVTGLLIASA